MDLTKTKIATKEYGESLIADIIAELKRKDAHASNTLINSLTYKLKEGVEELNVLLVGEDYFKYVDEGRRPGKIPRIGKLKKWAAIKGIPEKAVFAIAKKIGRFGVKPKNIIKDMISHNTLSDDDNKLAEAFKADVEQFIEINLINK